MMSTARSLMQWIITIFVSASISFAATTIYVPDGSTPNTQISSCTGTSPTICTTVTDHGFSAGDTVLLYNMVENTGSTVQYSGMNAPAGSARKVSAVGLTHNTLAFTDLAGTAVNTTNTVLINSGLVRKVVLGSIPDGPRVGMDGWGGPVQMAIAATILDGTLTNIVSNGTLATVTTAYPHGRSTGDRVQVRNASVAALNGIKTITVTGTTTYTYPTTATAGTYTDANLSVSARAIDGEGPWEQVKFYATNYATSAKLNWHYQAGNNADARVWENWNTAAMWYFVDPAQTGYRDLVNSALANYEDFEPGPQMCDEGVWSSYCRFSDGNSRQDTTDYLRISVPAFASTVSIMRARNQISGPLLTSIANYLLNDVDTNCVHATYATGPGTITTTETLTGPGQAVTGTSTTFTTTFPAPYGQYLFYNNGTSITWHARVISVTDDTHMTVTLHSGSITNHSYVPLGNFANVANSCGVRNLYNHHVASDGSRDARLYQSPKQTGDVITGWGGNEGNWTISQGNNQSLTPSAANVSIGSALADVDSRALTLLQKAGTFIHDYHLSEMVGTWGGSTLSGLHYARSRTWWMNVFDNTVAMNSSNNFPNFITQGATRGAMSVAYALIYSHLPNTLTNDPRWMGWLAGYPNWDQVSDGGSAAGYSGLEEVTKGITEGQYWKYFIANKTGTAWSVGGNTFSAYAIEMFLMYDPNVTATNYTTLPTQIELHDSDYAKCGPMGLTCNLGTNLSTFAQQQARRSLVISRTGWTGNVTLLSVSTQGWATDSQANDHSPVVPGNYHIVRNISGQTGANVQRGCLLGDDAATCFGLDGAGSAYNNPVWKIATALDAGNAWIGATTQPVSYGPVMSRWSGADRYGDPSSRYMAVTWDLSQFFQPSDGVTRADRSFIHFKDTGDNEFVMVYDNVQRTTGYGISAYEHYPQGATSGSGTAGTTTFAGGQITSTNVDNQRILTQVLAPAGATSLATIFDGQSYTGNQSGQWAYRLRECASTDGATCNASATSMEDIVVHLVTDNTVSSFTPTLISPDANWTCAQATGPTTSSVGCFARGGLQNAPSAFTTTYSGTAPILLTGLNSGTYNVTMNGVPVSGSPFTVAPGNNSIYFKSTAGNLSFGGTPVLQVKGKVSVQGSVTHQ